MPTSVETREFDVIGAQHMSRGVRAVLRSWRARDRAGVQSGGAEVRRCGGAVGRLA